MYLHANDSRSKKYDLIDTRTGKEILGVIWADDTKGEYEQLIYKKRDGKINVVALKNKSKAKTVKKNDKFIKLVKKQTGEKL